MSLGERPVEHAHHSRGNALHDGLGGELLRSRRGKARVVHVLAVVRAAIAGGFDGPDDLSQWDLALSREAIGMVITGYGIAEMEAEDSWACSLDVLQQRS